MKKRHLKNQPHLLRIKNEKQQKSKSKLKPTEPKVEKVQIEIENYPEEDSVKVNYRLGLKT